MKYLLVLWLIIVSDGVGAMVGARAAFNLRDKDHKRPEQTIALGVFLAGYGIARFWVLVNSVLNGVHGIDYSTAFTVNSTLANLLQCVAVWALALTLMNGHRGFIRRGMSRVFKRFE